MTTIQLRETHGETFLEVTFPGWERMMAPHATFTASAHTVAWARSEPGWTSEILGWRRGLAVSGYLKIGRFTHPDGTRRLVAMRRDQPLLRVRLEHSAYDELLLSTPDAPNLAAALDPARRSLS